MSSSKWRFVVARKRHTCLWCSEAIKKGELYTLNEWADGDTHGMARFHAECNAAMDNAAAYDYSLMDGWCDEGCHPKFERGHYCYL